MLSYARPTDWYRLQLAGKLVTSAKVSSLFRLVLSRFCNWLVTCICALFNSICLNLSSWNAFWSGLSSSVAVVPEDMFVFPHVRTQNIFVHESWHKPAVSWIIILFSTFFFFFFHLRGLYFFCFFIISFSFNRFCMQSS